MKNARKFEKAKYHTLTEEEQKKIINLINEICDAHEEDKWWKVDLCIRAWVNSALIRRAADEEFIELEAEDESDE